MTEDAMPLDKLAKIYRKIRGAMQQLTAEYETKLKELEEQRDVVANALKDQMQALGTKSVNTSEGTVVLSTKTRYYSQDWDAFKQFLLAQGETGFDLVEKRIAQTNMANFLKDNPGLVPPGLNSEAELVISVRKPK